MFNLIRSDLYRMTHMLSFWIICFLFIEETGLFCIITAAEDHLNFNISLEMTNSGIPLLLVAAFVSTFVTTEYKNGYIKNVAGVIPNRILMLFSKLIIASVFILISFILTVGSLTVFGMLRFGSEFFVDTPDFYTILAFFAIQFLLYLAISAIIILIASFSRSNAAGCISGFAISVNFVYQFVMMIYRALSENGIVPEDINVGNFMITPHISTISIKSEQDAIVYACIAGAVYLVIFATLAGIVIKKKDVR